GVGGGRGGVGKVVGGVVAGWRGRLPEGGVWLWARLPQGDARDFVTVALRHGVALVAGPQFAPGEAWVDYVRLPFTAEPDQLHEGAMRIANAWGQFRPGVAGPAFYQRAVV